MLIGGLAAGSFYLLQPLAGYYIMFALWIGVWSALGIWNERLRGGLSNIRGALIRGAIAAVGSGIAFYTISGIWRPFDPQGLDYLLHFAAWILPYSVAFGALLIGRERAAAQ
jgi:hypothetical protein